MSGLFSGTNRKVKALGLMVLFLFALLTSFYGCTEKKEAGPKGAGEVAPPAVPAVPTCELIDKLPGDIGKKVNVDYDKKVKLLGITVEKSSKEQVKLTSYWQLTDDLGIFDNVFVHFTGADNQILFQGDHGFCQKRPFAELKGKVIKETQTISVPPSALGKEVEVKIGMYELTTPNMDRLKIKTVTGVVKDDNDTRAAVEKLNL